MHLKKRQWCRFQKQHACTIKSLENIIKRYVVMYKEDNTNHPQTFNGFGVLSDSLLF